MGDRPPSSIARTRQNALARQQPQENLFDTHPEVSLDFEIVRQAARQKYTRPFLIVDTAIVRGKVRRFPGHAPWAAALGGQGEPGPAHAQGPAPAQPPAPPRLP